MSEFLATTVRCFRLLRNGPSVKRRGVWLMTGDQRGVFFHGDREESQAPRYHVVQLASGRLSDLFDDGWDDVQEIDPAGALRELESWPAAQRDAIRVFLRHPKNTSLGDENERATATGMGRAMDG